MNGFVRHAHPGGWGAVGWLLKKCFRYNQKFLIPLKN
jgi:hypothetical protein